LISGRIVPNKHYQRWECLFLLNSLRPSDARFLRGGVHQTADGCPVEHQSTSPDRDFRRVFVVQAKKDQGLSDNLNERRTGGLNDGLGRIAGVGSIRIENPDLDQFMCGQFGIDFGQDIVLKAVLSDDDNRAQSLRFFAKVANQAGGRCLHALPCVLKNPREMLAHSRVRK